MSSPSHEPAVVRRIVDEADGVRAFDLVPRGGVQRYPLGSHIELQVQAGGRRALRCYSLVGEQAQGGAYRIAVKKIADSRGGSRYLWSLQPGATVLISAPRSHFELRPDCAEYLLIAGGIGVTPLVGMAQALARCSARFRMLYAGRARERMACLGELSALLGERLQVFVGTEGARLDFAHELRQLHREAEVYVCGPIGLMEAVQSAWRDEGRPASHLRIETFGSSGHRRAEAFRVSVIDHGRELAVGRDQSLLEALSGAGIEVPGHCRRGECGLCAVRVIDLDGELDHRDVFLDDKQKAKGDMICACVSRALGCVVIDTGYRPF